MLIYADIRKCIEENDMINNGTIDRLIREDKISNEMATSLINDSSYKNEIFKDLLASSEIMFGNNILNNTTKLSDKKEENWLPKEV
ncbi:MAG: hypothetical protein LBU14_04220 [Candidatus Peribacteria bacterium]|nr:hypothetical protein [Candidatus Peribacteria bacterium]